MYEFRTMGWWIWLAMVISLTTGHFVSETGFLVAIGVGVFQVGLYLILKKDIAAFPVQVRLGFLAMLLIAQWSPLHFLYWIQFAGGWALIIFGYCPLARMMILLPWNRGEPFSLALVKRTALRPPVKGSIIEAGSAAG